MFLWYFAWSKTERLFYCVWASPARGALRKMFINATKWVLAWGIKMSAIFPGNLFNLNVSTHIRKNLQLVTSSRHCSLKVYNFDRIICEKIRYLRYLDLRDQFGRRGYSLEKIEKSCRQEAFSFALSNTIMASSCALYMKIWLSGSHPLNEATGW